MKKLFPIIAAISLFATAAQAHVHSASRPNGSVTTNSRVEKSTNGTTSVDRTTEIETTSKNGSAVTIDIDVEREYDPANNPVSSSKSTKVVSQDGSTINHSAEHEYNSTKQSLTSNSSTTVSKDGVAKTHHSERRYSATKTNTRQKNGSSTSAQPPVK